MGVDCQLTVTETVVPALHSLFRRYVPSGRFAGPTLKPLRFLTGESFRDPAGVFSASCERLGAMVGGCAGCEDGVKR